jgi:TolB-like protein
MIDTMTHPDVRRETKDARHHPHPEIRKSSQRVHARYLLWTLTLAFILIAGACAQSDRHGRQKPLGGSLESGASEPYTAVLESSYLSADKLARALVGRQFSPNTPIMAASFVDIDNLTTSSTFGRIVSEQIASRLAQHGFRIIEMKLRQESVFIKRGEGEFMLSRELRDLGSSREIGAALVGTYAVSEHFIFVSARIVRTEDSTVLAGCDYEIPNDDITRSLMR